MSLHPRVIFTIISLIVVFHFFSAPSPISSDAFDFSLNPLTTMAEHKPCTIDTIFDASCRCYDEGDPLFQKSLNGSHPLPSPPSEFYCTMSEVVPEVASLFTATKCSGSPPYDRIPNRIEKPLKWQHHLQNFKRHTAWLQGDDAWRDWYPSNDCSIPRSDGSGKLFFNQSTGLYTLENVCLRANGSLASFRPTVVDEFDGHDDCGTVDRITSYMAARDVLLRMETLPSPPECVVHQPVILLPLGMSRTSNTGHLFHRFGSVLRMKETIGSDVPLVLLFNRESFREKRRGQESDMVQAVSPSWLSVFEHGDNGSVLVDYFSASDISPGENDNEQYRSSLKEPMCFDTMYYYYDCRTCEVADDSPFLRHSFRLHGVRSARDVDTMSMITTKYRQCFGIAQRRANPFDLGEKVQVLFSVRSRDRRILFQPLIVHALRREFSSDIEVTLFEHSKYTFRRIVEVYSATDVVFGVYGAAHMWNVFLPHWAVGVMLSLLPQLSELNVPREKMGLEYSNEAVAANHSNMLYYSPAELRKISTDEWFPGWESVITPQHSVALINTTLCAVAAGSRESATQQCRMPNLTGWLSTTLPRERVSLIHWLAWTVASHSSAAASRVRVYLQQPELLLKALVDPFPSPFEPRVVSVLHGPCLTEGSTLELSFIHNFFFALDMITFSELNATAAKKSEECQLLKPSVFPYALRWGSAFAARFVPLDDAVTSAHILVLSADQLRQWSTRANRTTNSFSSLRTVIVDVLREGGTNPNGREDKKASLQLARTFFGSLCRFDDGSIETDFYIVVCNVSPFVSP